MGERDTLHEYAEIRAEYVNQLDEADLLNDQGFLRDKVVAGLWGVGLVGPEEFPEVCREPPMPDWCYVINGRSMAEEFLDIREQYRETLEERNLLAVRSLITDAVRASSSVGTGGNAGIPAPGTDPDDIPWPLRPYVDPGRMAGGGLPMRVAARF